MNWLGGLLCSTCIVWEQSVLSFMKVDDHFASQNNSETANQTSITEMWVRGHWEFPPQATENIIKDAGKFIRKRNRTLARMLGLPLLTTKKIGENIEKFPHKHLRASSGLWGIPFKQLRTLARTLGNSPALWSKEKQILKKLKTQNVNSDNSFWKISF